MTGDELDNEIARLFKAFSAKNELASVFTKTQFEIVQSVFFAGYLRGAAAQLADWRESLAEIIPCESIETGGPTISHEQMAAVTPH